MLKKTIRMSVWLLMGVLLLAGFDLALAQGGGFDLTWFTVDGGGASGLSGGGFTLSGTAGQPEAGATSGGGYALVGGFWAGLAARPEPDSYLYLPLVLR
jgi:hypothetical protein